MTEENTQLSAEEQDALKQALGFGAPMPEEKHNVHQFLHNVAIAEDTTKLGYLKDEEIGVPKLPVRAFKDMALIADRIMGNDFLREYYLNKSENITSTSLSRDGFLVKLAVVQKRVIEDATKKRKENKSWFKRKESSDDTDQSLEKV